MLILHIDLDAFFVSVEQALDPSLKGKPVIVGGRLPKRGVVAAASYEARKFGIHSAMPLATAYRLCPKAIFLEGNFQRYQEASEGFFNILADYTPFIEPGGLDEAYLDITGFEVKFGSAKALGEHIRQRIRNELHITASVGISSSKLVSKVASDRAKPDGLLEVPAGTERAFLAPLPVRDMPGVGPKGERLLKEMGIHTISQLAKASPLSLKSRLGQWGEVLIQHANGLDDRKVEAPGEAKSISRETTFEEDSSDRAFLKATLRYLAERVGADLRQQGKTARCVDIKLRYADFETISRQATLPRPSDADQVIYEAGLKLLQKAFLYRWEKVRLLGIGVSHFQESSQQLQLWDEKSEKTARLNRVIDKVRKKYGFDAIQSGQTVPLGKTYKKDNKGYHLHTPSLSR